MRETDTDFNLGLAIGAALTAAARRLRRDERAGAALGSSA